MKVNISGVGLIPKVGLLAPVYGKDLTKDTVNVILKYASFKVYVAATGVRITKKNIDEIFGTVTKQTSNPVKKAPVVETVVTNEPVEIEQVEEPVVFDTLVEAPAIEESLEEVSTDDAIDTEDTVEETVVVEEKPTYTNKKKKRR